MRSAQRQREFAEALAGDEFPVGDPELAELVDEGITGFIVPALDVEAIAQRAVQLLGSEEMRERMGRAGRERALTSFDTAVCAETHRRAYELALGRPIQRPETLVAA